MSVIVDTSVWIDGFNPKSNNSQRVLLTQLIETDYPIFLCPIIYQEVLQGIRDDKSFEKIQFILQQYRMLHIDIMHVTNYAVDLYRHLRKKGITIRKSVDYLIASYAIISEIPLLHNDNDFTQIARGSKLTIYSNSE